VVENEKQARALIKRINIAHPQAELRFWLLNEHTKDHEISGLLAALENADAGIISDAGLPCIADPGASLVALAQTKGIEVIPLPGASSTILTLMGSGFNGQQFSFIGYLPIDKNQRIKRIKEIEAIGSKGISQIFMETPYRNNQLLNDLLANIHPNALLCIGCKVGSNSGWVKTKSIAKWRTEIPDIHKQPSIFILGI
jgi:16S rRNA (cytidine1402-2'-O)-methyltransferase